MERPTLAFWKHNSVPLSIIVNQLFGNFEDLAWQVLASAAATSLGQTSTVK
jgi:hypothetical protein